jgi:signal transduction histidine kinase
LTKTAHASAEPQPSVARTTAPSPDIARLSTIADYHVIDRDGRSLVANDGVQAQLQALTQVAARLCGVPFAVVTIIGDRYETQLAATGVTPGVCSIDDSICAAVLDPADVVVITDTAQDERLRHNPYVDGTLGALRFFASAPLRVPSGQVIGTLCVADLVRGDLNLTGRADLAFLAQQVVETLELRRRTLQLMVAVDELSRRNEVLADFVGRASHDLRTPLTAITGFAELLRTVPAVSADPRAAEFAGHVVRSSRRMRELIDDLLTFASVGGQLTISKVDVSEVVAEVLADITSAEEESPLHVRVEGSVIQADRVQLRALIQNLVVNAYRHSGVATSSVPSSAPVEVIAGPAPSGGWTLRVIDHGMGIPSADRDRALEPFVRLGPKGDDSGTGLGLATCVQIAHAHGGTLQISETPGGGTTVTIDVPGTDG